MYADFLCKFNEKSLLNDLTLCIVDAAVLLNEKHAILQHLYSLSRSLYTFMTK